MRAGVAVARRKSDSGDGIWHSGRSAVGTGRRGSCGAIGGHEPCELIVAGVAGHPLVEGSSNVIVFKGNKRPVDPYAR